MLIKYPSGFRNAFLRFICLYILFKGGLGIHSINAQDLDIPEMIRVYGFGIEGGLDILRPSGDEFHTENFLPGLHAGIYAPISNVFGLQSRIRCGYLKGSDNKLDRSFSTGLAELSFLLDLNLNNLFSFRQINFERRTSLYLFGGYGFMRIAPSLYELTSKNPVISNKDRHHSLVSGSFPYGLRIEYRLNEKLNLHVEVGSNATTTDYLDMTAREGTTRDYYSFSSVSLFYKFRSRMETNPYIRKGKEVNKRQLRMENRVAREKEVAKEEEERAELAEVAEQELKEKKESKQDEIVPKVAEPEAPLSIEKKVADQPYTVVVKFPKGATVLINHIQIGNIEEVGHQLNMHPDEKLKITSYFSGDDPSSDEVIASSRITTIKRMLREGHKIDESRIEYEIRRKEDNDGFVQMVIGD